MPVTASNCVTFASDPSRAALWNATSSPQSFLRHSLTASVRSRIRG